MLHPRLQRFAVIVVDQLSVEMRLLTHNMLTSHIKGVKNGYPLRIEVKILSQ